MLNSLKKWVKDVAVDLAPPLPQSSPPTSSLAIRESAYNNFYTATPMREQRTSRDSSSSAVYLSRPMSMESVRTSQVRAMSIPPMSPPSVELDLSHLNREEQEHIANVLRRARAVEEQQSTLVSTSVPSIMSPPASTTSSMSSSSSTTSSASLASEQPEKNDNEILEESEMTVAIPESTLTNIYSCQTCGKRHQENSSICFECQEKDFMNRDTEKNMTFLTQQLVPIKKSSSPTSITYNSNKYDEKVSDNMLILDTEKTKSNSPKHESRTNINQNRNDQSTTSDLLRANNLTEIDENEFFYDEPSPYVAAIKPDDNYEELTSSYQIDEFIDEDNDERDHVKELEETIANLTRHFPCESIERNVPSVLPISSIDNAAILEMEIESPSVDEVPFIPSAHTSSLSISIPTPINNHRLNISRSAGVRENLTDLLIPVTTVSHQTLPRTLSTQSKDVFSMGRQRRNLPSVPNATTSNRLQLRRANSESHFSLPTVPLPILTPQQNLDDENDLLEIDLKNPYGSMSRDLSLKLIERERKMNNKYESLNTSMNGYSSKVKQLRDQTTNTPPITNFDTTTKLKKKLKKKISSPPVNNSDQNTSPTLLSSEPFQPTTPKLQKSTSTEITYPFPVTKLILTSSRHGVYNDPGFRITGGHSIPHCTEVTACIENINVHHRNYDILKNIVQEGDEVLELGGVSLRGKSALFVENLTNSIRNEFEITVRSQNISIHSDSSTTMDSNSQRRYSIDPVSLTSIEPTNSIMNKPKPKSISVSSLNQTSSTVSDSSHKDDALPILKASLSDEKPTDSNSNRQLVNLLPNDPRLTGAFSNASIDQQISNESDESDSLSQYFNSPQKSKTNSATVGNNKLMCHGRSQSVTPLESDITGASRRLQNFIKSDTKRSSKDLSTGERKSSFTIGSLPFLKKKTKSVDLTQSKNAILNQLRENHYVGEIELQIRHDSEQEQLVVIIIRARNLLPKDTNGFSDPFVKVNLLPGRDAENKRRIKHIPKTLNPVWNHTVVYANMHREELQYKKLEFTVWDYDRFKSNDFLGQVTIDLKNPSFIDDKPHWFRLQAFRSREEMTNRSSSPRLQNLTSIDSTASSTSTINKNFVNMQPRINQTK